MLKLDIVFTDKQNCTTHFALKKMAGIRGFEPLNDGIKTRCLTAWLYPYRGVTTLNFT